MAWTTPKTDWVSTDSFNLTPDYDRIKGNIEYLYELSVTLYGPVRIQVMGNYGISDFPYPSFLNTIVENTRAIRDNGFSPPGYAEMRTYAGNEPGWNEVDLNIIEGNHLALYSMMRGQLENARKIPFEIGGSEF